MALKKTKAGQLAALIVSTIFTGFMILFIQDSGSASAIGITFTGIVGTFIGLDIAGMVRKTRAMDSGYKAMNMHRYIISIVIFSVLLIESFIISALLNRNCDSLYTSFGMGFLAVIGGIIGGIEGNKIATKKSAEQVPGKTSFAAEPEITNVESEQSAEINSAEVRE
jgi:hypothetical protein